jgi:hypothetical protein
MSRPSSEEIANRRRLEDVLRACGDELEWLEYKRSINRGMVRAVLAEARAAGITVREISRLSGLSTQTLHTWMQSHMRPVPAAHLGKGGPPAHSLVEAALRTIAEDPDDDWSPDDVRAAIPKHWPNGTTEEVELALETLARTHQIWGGESRYRLGPPDEVRQTTVVLARKASRPKRPASERRRIAVSAPVSDLVIDQRR